MQKFQDRPRCVSAAEDILNIVEWIGQALITGRHDSTKFGLKMHHFGRNLGAKIEILNTHISKIRNL